MLSLAAFQLPKWRAFSALAVTFITLVFALAFALLALPNIAADFDVTLRTVGWVVIIESLIIAALLLPLGGLADILGDKRVLSIGLAIFGVGALLTGLSPTFTALIGARIVMAIGNALVQSVTTGLIISLFPDHERGLAMGAQTAAVSVGAASAPLLGGLGLEFLSWNTIFLLMAIPIGISWIAVRVLIPDRQRSGGGIDRRFDVRGSVLSALAITVLVVTISNPFSLPWLSLGILSSAAVAAVLLANFIRWELRIDQPLFQLRLFAERGFRTSVALRTFGFLASAPSSLLLPVFLLSFRQLNTVVAGVIIAALSVGMGTGGQLSGRAYDRMGPRAPTLLGFSFQVVVSLGLAFSTADTSLVFLGFLSLFAGVSIGLWNVPNNSAMLSAIPPAYLGVGGAFTNVTRTLGGAVGQALVTAVVAGVMTARGFDVPLGNLGDNLDAGVAFNSGWKVVYLLSAGLSGALFFVATQLNTTQDNNAPA